MKEEFLHYIWHHKLFYDQSLKTTNGDAVHVLSPGIYNRDEGPDFLQTRLKIGDTVWAGNVEIHVKASDWAKHGHDDHPAYKNLIAHVVMEADKKHPENIPLIELDFPDFLLSNYHELLMSRAWIPCRQKIRKVSEFHLFSWLDTLLVERLERKSNQILEYHKKCNYSWDETLYVTLARNFGFNLNAEPFANLALSLPLKILRKHSGALLQMEALLFGQAGMLADASGDSYYLELRKEYLFLRGKYQLRPLSWHIWKFLRLRPVNFPTLRIAQFAAFLHHHNNDLFNSVTQYERYKDIKGLFNFEVSEYWETHYKFNVRSSKKSKSMGHVSIQAIIINTVAPFLFIYGKQTKRNQFSERALRILEQMPAENNTIIRGWKNLGIESLHAGTSQALIQLKNEYCNYRKCLHCRIGNEVLKVTHA